MPVRTREEVSSGSREVGRKSTPARDVINCTCWKKRESAAKNKRDWVQCDLCRCWSHPSCYRIAQSVVAKEEVPFYCFFCQMKWMSKQTKENCIHCERLKGSREGIQVTGREKRRYEGRDGSVGGNYGRKRGQNKTLIGN